MSRSQQNHEKRVVLADRLRQLARDLPDQILATSLPGLSPEAARATLNEAAGILAPVPEPEGPVQPSLFGAKKRGKDFTLFTDGASRGNPGEAGAGMVLVDENGGEIHARGVYLGQCTNNVAEYQALILGLKAARELGAGTLAIRLDSELIVRQLLGRYKVKNEKLKPLFRQARELLKGVAYNVAHVPREQNRRADELANRAIDEKGR